jgi:hypothetical protein
MKRLADFVIRSLDVHFLVVGTLSAIVMAVLVLERRPDLPFTVGLLFAPLMSALLLLVCSLAMWPFREGFRGLAGYLVANFIGGAVAIFLLFALIFGVWRMVSFLWRLATS